MMKQRANSDADFFYSHVRRELTWEGRMPLEIQTHHKHEMHATLDIQSSMFKLFVVSLCSVSSSPAEAALIFFGLCQEVCVCA